MSRVLIAGCGYVGAKAAELFARAGWEVEGWTRSGAGPDVLAAKPHLVRGVNLSERAEVAAAPGEFEVVIHCASTRGGDAASYRAVYAEGARNLRQRFAQARFLFCSSTSVYGQAGGEIVTEECPAEPEPETGRILRLTESEVLARGGLVLRLAGIYGPGRSVLLRRFLRGEAVIDPEQDRFVNQVHRDDAATALFFLAAQQAGSGIYNVGDNEPMLLSECYRWLAQELERALPPTGKASLRRKRGASNKRVSNARLRALGWSPEFPSMREGMSESVLPGLERYPV